MKDMHDIIKSPVLTEKSYDQIPQKKYTFLVDVDANKTEIKTAIEGIFGVKLLGFHQVGHVFVALGQLVPGDLRIFLGQGFDDFFLALGGVEGDQVVSHLIHHVNRTGTAVQHNVEAV